MASQDKKRRMERAKLKRKGFQGFILLDCLLLNIFSGIGEADVVGMFSHHKPLDSNAVSIKEHKTESDDGIRGTIYTVNTEV